MFLLHSPCLSSNGLQLSLGISTLICNTLLLVGRQWWLNHCPASPPGFQLCSSLSFHKRLFLLQKLFCKYFYFPILQTATVLSFPVSPNACLETARPTTFLLTVLLNIFLHSSFRRLCGILLPTGLQFWSRWSSLPCQTTEPHLALGLSGILWWNCSLPPRSTFISHAWAFCNMLLL